MPRLLIFLLLVFLTSCGATPAAQSTSAMYSIIYRVTGAATSAQLTVQNSSGTTEQFDEVRVPWQTEFIGRRMQLVFVSAQSQQERELIGCEIVVNGVLVDEDTSRGRDAVATCSASIE